MSENEHVELSAEEREQQVVEYYEGQAKEVEAASREAQLAAHKARYEEVLNAEDEKPEPEEVEEAPEPEVVPEPEPEPEVVPEPEPAPAEPEAEAPVEEEKSKKAPTKKK